MKLLKSFSVNPLTLILVLISFKTGFSQVDSLIKSDIYHPTTLESQAIFPGGIESEELYFKKKLKNILSPDKYSASGKPYILKASVTIEKDGSVSNVYLLKIYQFELDQETQEKIISAIASMPKWISGKILNEPISSRYIIPISLNNY